MSFSSSFLHRYILGFSPIVIVCRIIRAQKEIKQVNSDKLQLIEKQPGIKGGFSPIVMIADEPADRSRIKPVNSDELQLIEKQKAKRALAQCRSSKKQMPLDFDPRSGIFRIVVLGHS
jgi:hypothetical protein